jgi:hypothetical protein
MVRVAGEPECTPMPLTAVCRRNVVCLPAFMPKSATRQISVHAKRAALEDRRSSFCQKCRRIVVAARAASPPPQSAEIPLVDEQFSAGTNHRQLTVSYQVLPPKGRKAARYATREPQCSRYRTERNATVHRLELTPLTAYVARNNNINHRLATKA